MADPRPQPAKRSARVVFDATGAGEVSIFPSGYDWVIDLAATSSTSSTLQPTVDLYRGSVSEATRIDGSYTGAKDSARGLGTFTNGEPLIARWTAGDAGATGTLRVEARQYEPGRAPPDSGGAYQPFANSVVGGNTLVRDAIQSPGYTPGTTGWSVNATGSAEFNNVTIRGVLSSTPSALSTDPVIAVRAIGDTFDLFDMNAAGSMSWGGGNAPTDTFLFRNGAGQLEINPSLLVQGVLVAVSGHVTGNLNVDTDVNVTGNVNAATVAGAVLPGNVGLSSWTFDTAAGHSNAQPAAGVVHLARLVVSQGLTPANLVVDVDVAGTGLANTSVGLYDSGGNLIKAITGLSPTFQSGGVKSISLAGIAAITSGIYYAAILVGSATTPPSLTAGSGKAGLSNAGIAAAPFRYMTSGSGLTTLPNAITLGAATASDKPFWWGLK